MTIPFLSLLKVFFKYLKSQIRFIVLLKIGILVRIHKHQTSVSVFLALSIACCSVSFYIMPHKAALDSPYTMNYHATCLFRNCYYACILSLIPAIYYYPLIRIIQRVYAGFP